MSNKRRRNEEEDDLEAEDNKRPRNQDDLEELDEEDTDTDTDTDTDEYTEYTDDDDDEDTDDDDDEQLEDGPFLKNSKYFSSECLPDQSDIDEDDDDDDDCGLIGDLVDQQPFNEDDDQEEHDAFERRIEARRSPIMCSGQKEVGIVEEEEEEENRDSGGDNKGNGALADILVTVHKPGEDSSIGVVRHVLPDGSFKIALGSSGNGEVIIAVRSEIEIVAPRVSDKVKIMGGAQHGATGKLIDTEEGDAIVKVDGDTLYNKDLVLDMNILAKLA